jgi:hypothetical protein
MISEKLRAPETVERKRARAPFEVRGVAMVRDAATGRPKFDLPMCMYPSWAQEGFRQMMTPAEIAEFFGA